MPSARANNSVVVIAFSFVGFLLAPVFLGFSLDWIFYTTKPEAFLNGWHMLVFLVLFGLSIGSVPFAALIAQHFDCSSRYRRFSIILASAWLVSVFVSSLLVRFITAAVHHATLDIPAGLVPVGLFFVPSVAIATVLFIGFRRARRYEPCA
jgi:MFS family permease